jgi:Domain of unknown function (DUF1844)
MSDPSTIGSGATNASSTPDTAEQGQDPRHAALFAQMVMQQSNLALMMLGKTPHPETGQPVRDLEAAKLFIDQLEMLEAKTKGNLSRQESALLKQSLMTLHLAFVEAVNSPEPTAKPAEPAAASIKEDARPAENKTEAAENPGAAVEEESRKRFSKKY